MVKKEVKPCITRQCKGLEVVGRSGGAVAAVRPVVALKGFLTAQEVQLMSSLQLVIRERRGSEVS